MGKIIQKFTFDRNTFKRSCVASANSVAEHIAKVEGREPLDKGSSNVVGALSSYMGVFAKGEDGAFLPTELARVFLELYRGNKADAWRWLVARSLWRFVVPNGTRCKVNTEAREQDVTFTFFHQMLQILVHLSAEVGDKRFLFFEELCNLFKEGAPPETRQSASCDVTTSFQTIVTLLLTMIFTVDQPVCRSI